MKPRKTVPRICATCHAPFEARVDLVSIGRGRFCSKSCQVRDQHKQGVPLGARTGAAHHNWKGGVSRQHGYVLLEQKNVPNIRTKQHYVREHDLVVEKIIGRRLKRGEHAHHMDEDKTNNDPLNLALMENGDHVRLHSLINGARQRCDFARVKALQDSIKSVGAGAICPQKIPMDMWPKRSLERQRRLSRSVEP